MGVYMFEDNTINNQCGEGKFMLSMDLLGYLKGEVPT